MKKFITILCIFALASALFGCGGKIRKLENYSVGEYNGGWSVLYTDEQGVEEIAALGAERQPLAIEKGRIYFTEGSRLVSVDMEGEDRLETVLEGMPEGTHITYADGENFYCVADPADITCWRVSKADQSDWARITIPRAFRSVDFDALTAQITAQVAAKEDQIHVNAARMTLDSNGSLLTMELETLAYDNIIGGMKTWNTGRVTVRLTLSGSQVNYTDLNVPVRVSDKTIDRTLSLTDFLTAVSALDSAEAAVKTAVGIPEGFRLMYLVDEYEACITAELPYLNTDGESVDADGSARHFVLAQVGGCDTMLTDSTGTACGNLQVIALG